LKETISAKTTIAKGQKIKNFEKKKFRN